VRIVDDQFEKLIMALTTIKIEIDNNKSEIEAIANKLNDKAPKEGSIAIVGTIDGVPGTVEGAYLAEPV